MAYANSKGSGEPVHLCNLVRTCAVHSCKWEAKGKPAKIVDMLPC